MAGIAGAAGVSGCGGGVGSGSPMSSMAPASGVAMVTLTDAPGDFLSYQLAVVSLKLTRADGTAVEILPAPSKVEFAQLARTHSFDRALRPDRHESGRFDHTVRRR